MNKSTKANILKPLSKKTVSKDIRFRAKYSDGDILPIFARCITIANAIARLYSNGRSYGVKEV